MPTVAPSYTQVLPKTHQIDLQRRRNSQISVELGASVNRSRNIDRFAHGAAWPWRGVWVFVVNVSWCARTPYRWVWDWSRCADFSYETVHLSFLSGFNTASPLSALQRLEPPIRIEPYIQSWIAKEQTGVDGVPFRLHAIQDSVARNHAVQAYLNEQSRLHVY